jgi:hypothetical protein
MLEHFSAIANAFDAADNVNIHSFLRLDCLFKMPSLSEETLAQQQQGSIASVPAWDRRLCILSVCDRESSYQYRVTWLPEVCRRL